MKKVWIPDYLSKEQKRIILHHPVHDAITGITFSVGTRFVLDSLLDDQDIYIVRYIQSDGQSLKELSIPKNVAYRDERLTPTESRQRIINFLQDLVDNPSSIVPFVLGGNSHTRGVPKERQKSFYWAEGYWHGPIHGEHMSGFDCSGLIWMAARLCGMSCPIRNTWTFMQLLTPLSKYDQLLPGYLLIFPQHMYIVFDVEQQLVCDAEGYDYGYGRVSIRPLKECFSNITSWNSLIHACLTKIPVGRKDIHGQELYRQHLGIYKLIPHE